MAADFVLVRLTRIDDLDLNLFEFDYDLTFMVFFMDASGRVYARYGGRDEVSADNRQSLEGLRYTMQSVLEMHRREDKSFAPRTDTQRLFASDVTGWYGGGCMHCHQVQEAVNDKLKRDGKWKRDHVWRFPLPENIGLRLEVDRGNIVERVSADSPAAQVGLEPGDRLERVGEVPIHSFADVQFALSKAPIHGELPVIWRRDDQLVSGKAALPPNWRKTDITWRASVRWRYVPSWPMSGDDLTPDERRAMGLMADQMAFRAVRLKPAALAAGIREGDVILTVDDKELRMTALEFRQHIRREYVVGDTIQVRLVRAGESLTVPLTLGGQ